MMTLLLSTYATQSTLAEGLDYLCKSQGIDPRCHCYTEVERRALSSTISNLGKCNIELRQANEVIEERLTTFDGAEGLHWWQEPTAIYSGVVVSFSVGALLGYYFIDR